MNNAISIVRINNEQDLKEAHEIRRIVFVIEQNCPPELEYEHEEDSIHYLARYNGTPCGAARWRKTANGYKLERFSVLKEFRGKGVANALVQFLLNDLPAAAKHIYLNAQVEAMPVYTKSGFKPRGELFEEAFIIHQQMYLDRI